MWSVPWAYLLLPERRDCRLPVPRDSVAPNHSAGERQGQPWNPRTRAGLTRSPLRAVCWDRATTPVQRLLGQFKGVTSLRSPSSLVLRDGASSWPSEREGWRWSFKPLTGRLSEASPRPPPSTGKGGARKSQVGLLVLPSDSRCHCPPLQWATESCLIERYFGFVDASMHNTRVDIPNPLREEPHIPLRRAHPTAGSTPPRSARLGN